MSATIETGLDSAHAALVELGIVEPKVYSVELGDPLDDGGPQFIAAYVSKGQAMTAYYTYVAGAPQPIGFDKGWPV